MKTLAKINADIASGDYGKARDRLHGLLATYPDDLTLRRRLGEVYWRLQYPAMAGRYWYLEETKTADMVAACEAFERSCGGSSLHILSALKFRGDVEAIGDTYAGRVLLALRERVRDEFGYDIDFQKRGADRYRLVPRAGWADRALIGGCVAGALAGVGLMGVGLYTILSRLLRK
jgi:hypothetical protein